MWSLEVVELFAGWFLLNIHCKYWKCLFMCVWICAILKASPFFCLITCHYLVFLFLFLFCCLILLFIIFEVLKELFLIFLSLWKSNNSFVLNLWCRLQRSRIFCYMLKANWRSNKFVSLFNLKNRYKYDREIFIFFVCLFIIICLYIVIAT